MLCADPGPHCAHTVSLVAKANWGSTEGVGNDTQENMEPLWLHTAGRKPQASKRRAGEPEVPLSETWRIILVMSAQPAPGECHDKKQSVFNNTFM